jgi:hypothetical protein
MLSSQTVVAPIDTLTHYPTTEANLRWLEYIVQDFTSGAISIDEAVDLILKTQ